MESKGRVVVIGFGSAGTAAARSLVAAGWQVTLVERDRAGGTCIWWGCMPKKALYNAARARRATERAEMFGLTPAEGYDWQSVLAWKWHAQETYAGDQEASATERGIRVVRGEARFSDIDTVVVDDTEVLPFDHAVIATGSRPVLPPVPGIGLADTSVDALSYPEVPRSMLVVGGGLIGMELSAVYAAFDTEITLITSGPRPLAALDPDTAAVAVERLVRGGATIHTRCRLTAIAGEPGALEATYTDAEGRSHSGTWERVLVATGRAPALEGLALDVAGVEVDSSGHIVHDGYLRTTNPSVWTAGDAAGGMMRTAVASYEGRTVAASIDSGTPRLPDHSAAPTCVFTSPQIGQAGITEAEARQQGIAIDVHTQPFEFLGAAVIEDQRDGLVKLIFAEDDGRLLGAHIAGPTAGDLAYAMSVALKHGATRDSLRATIGIHPAYNEALNWAAW